jgi:hypothetical protein
MTATGLICARAASYFSLQRRAMGSCLGGTHALNRHQPPPDSIPLRAIIDQFRFQRFLASTLSDGGRLVLRDPVPYLGRPGIRRVDDA